MNKKPVATAYLYDFQLLDLRVKDEAGFCRKIEMCPETGEYIRAFFAILGGEYWDRYREGLGVVFERPILNDKKESVYYLEQAKQARRDKKDTQEIKLLLTMAETAQGHEAEAEREEKKQTGLIKLKKQIWNV